MTKPRTYINQQGIEWLVYTDADGSVRHERINPVRPVQPRRPRTAPDCDDFL